MSAPPPDSRPLAIEFETPEGFFMREVRAASPLRQDLHQGTAAEVAAEDAAAAFGLPDFVVRAERSRLGSASREVGDRLIIAGRLGIVVQVKSRVAFSGDESEERAWIEKHGAKAIRQCDGTIRRLRAGTVPVVNARDRRFEVDGAGVDWVGVVVVDHPAPPAGLAVSLDEAKNPAVVLTRRDWEFLFRQLKSTSAVLGYFARVAGEMHELGAEAQRYFNLALADAAASPGELDPRIAAAGVRHSGPLLPMQEAAAGDDLREHLMIRAILEDVAMTPTSDLDEQKRLFTLAELDRLTPNDRAMVGRYLIEGLAIFGAAPEDASAWRVRRVVGRFAGAHHSQLAFGTTSTASEADRGLFGFWLRLRHHQLFELLDRDESLTSVGVQLAPRPDGIRDFDTSVFVVRGDLQLDAAAIAQLEAVWPINPYAPN